MLIQAESGLKYQSNYFVDLVQEKRGAEAPLFKYRLSLILNSLIVQVLWVIGLGEEEPALSNETGVLDQKGHH